MAHAEAGEQEEDKSGAEKMNEEARQKQIAKIQKLKKQLDQDLVPLLGNGPLPDEKEETTPTKQKKANARELPGDEPEDAKPEKEEKEPKKGGVTKGEDEFGEFEETMEKGKKQMD